MIERHFTLDRAYGGPDAAFSTEAAEFARLAADCRAAAATIGNGKIGEIAQEAPQRALRRSLHFLATLPLGHRIAPQDVAATRPADGLPPRFANAVTGRTLATDVKKGDPVTWDRLES